LHRAEKKPEKKRTFFSGISGGFPGWPRDIFGRIFSEKTRNLTDFTLIFTMCTLLHRAVFIKTTKFSEKLTELFAISKILEKSFPRNSGNFLRDFPKFPDFPEIPGFSGIFGIFGIFGNFPKFSGVSVPTGTSNTHYLCSVHFYGSRNDTYIVCTAIIRYDTVYTYYDIPFLGR